MDKSRLCFYQFCVEYEERRNFVMDQSRALLWPSLMCISKYELGYVTNHVELYILKSVGSDTQTAARNTFTRFAIYVQ